LGKTESAVWKNSKAVKYFTGSKQDETKYINKETCEVVFKISGTLILLDHTLMGDALKELSEISLKLQSRDVCVLLH
jgi:hypothetical protein